jgi:peptide/nickel transport system substrate-binding protein
MAFDLKQKTDVAGDVDLEKLTLDSADGLDEGAQKANVAKIAKVSNELLPIIPLYERYGNNAALEKVRVQAWPADDDPIMQNAPYADGIVTMLMLTGRLKPV